MLLKFLSRRSTGLWLVLPAILVAGCGGGENVRPESSDPSVIEAPIGEANQEAIGGVIVQGIDPDGIIESQLLGSEDPWELASLADNATGDEAVVLRLAAIRKFIELQEYPAAETQANYLFDAPLVLQQAVRLDLYRGQINSALGQHDLALSYLQPLRTDTTLSDDEQLVLYTTLANTQLALNRGIDALVSLMKRDALLADDFEQATLQLENQRRILSQLESLTQLEFSLLRETASRSGLPTNLVPGWAEFMPLARMNEQQRLVPLTRWANAYANHPARVELLGSAPLLNPTLDRYNHIALLLPITSPFGNAAQAFYDGFVESYNTDSNVFKPTVSLHDIGEDPALTAFYYQSAMNEGADFIVGPLGRSAVTGLLEGDSLPLPTLVLGDVAANQQAEAVYGISLSPELEAEQVAERAFENGHRQAAVFRSDSSQGARAARAFSEKWQALGGIIVSNKSFPTTIDDYSRIIQRLLEVNQSIARERVLSAQLGGNLVVTPRRRDDMDMLFFAGNAKQARLLIPQMRFFQAHDLPIYATSNIFSGKTNPAVDADLDEIIFGDMNWMLNLRYPEVEPAAQEGSENTAVTATPKARPVAKGPYSFQPLDRLYALGLESYHLIPRLSSMRRDQRQRYNGAAFGASVRADGNIIRHLDWATFNNGNISMLTNPDPVAAPLPESLAE